MFVVNIAYKHSEMTKGICKYVFICIYCIKQKNQSHWQYISTMESDIEMYVYKYIKIKQEDYGKTWHIQRERVH